MPNMPKSILVEPLEPLNIEEVRFWLRILEEHAIFIAASLPYTSTGLIDEAQGYKDVFWKLRQRADKISNEKKLMELLNDAYKAVCDFARYNRLLVQSAIKCNLSGSGNPLSLDHMAREAEYVMRLFDKIAAKTAAAPSGLKVGEIIFWLRLMTEHMKFIRLKLDPSERGLNHTAERFAREFDDLLLQAQDYSSLLTGVKGEIKAFRRFIQDVRVAVMRHRDFNKALLDMQEECSLLSAMPALYADHTTARLNIS